MCGIKIREEGFQFYSRLAELKGSNEGNGF